MSENLKPCPFCGSGSVYVEQIGRGGYFNVRCGNCLANIPLSGSRGTAVSAWNRRAIDVDALREVVAEIEDADVDGTGDWAERIRKAVGL